VGECRLVLVYSASRARKAYAFANRAARLHMGVMVRYNSAGPVNKHCCSSSVLGNLLASACVWGGNVLMPCNSP
jgi:hypothetical protein